MMKIMSERAKEIDIYLESHPKAELGKWPIEIGGGKKIEPFYKLPLTLLSYNANNGRLVIDRRRWEYDNKRLLDGNNPEDAEIIRGMLLQLDKDKTKLLKLDIRQKGQMEPGVVTHDGIVINGNRRMAIFEMLHQDEATGKWNFLEAVRLDPSVSEKDLWKIEAGLQLSKDKVMEYHPVNEILKIKEGKDRGLSNDELAAAMYAWEEKDITDALDRLKLIDSFLKFFGQENNYGVIKKFGLSEYFIDIQKRVIASAKREGIPNKEIKNRLKYTFALIRASILLPSDSKTKKITHWDIRKLHKVFSDAHARDEFVKPLEEAKKIQSVPDDEVIEGFRDGLDILDMRAERDKPLKLVEKAIHALESIDKTSIDNEKDEHKCARISEGLTSLSDLILELKGHIGGS